MSERRVKVLCMFFDESFTLSHHLKHRKAQLMIFEGEETEETLVLDVTNVEIPLELMLKFPSNYN